MVPLIAFLVLLIVSILFAVYKRVDTFEILAPYYSPLLITKDTKVKDLIAADAKKIGLLETLKTKYADLTQVAAVTPDEATDLGIATVDDGSGNKTITVTVNLSFLQDYISMELETYKMRKETLEGEGANQDITLEASMKAAQPDLSPEEFQARTSDVLVNYNEKESKFNAEVTTLFAIEKRSSSLATGTGSTGTGTTGTGTTGTGTTGTGTTGTGTTGTGTTGTGTTGTGTTGTTGTGTTGTTGTGTGTGTTGTTGTGTRRTGSTGAGSTGTGSTGSGSTATDASGSAVTTRRGTGTTTTTPASSSTTTLNLKDLAAALASIKGSALRPTDMEDTNGTAPSMSGGYTKEMEDRLAKRITTQVKNSLLTERNTNNILDDMSCPYAQYSNGVQQGREYQQVKPIQSAPDMSQYIRKDSIPCWNCSLP